MSWITDLFSSATASVVDSFGSAIDNLVTSDEERLQLKNELVKIQAGLEIEKQKLEAGYEKELTKRLELDMKSDSFLSKNIRPMAFIFMLAITTVFTFTDGNIKYTFEDGTKYEFIVKEGWTDLWTALTISFAVFYSGGRSIEKFSKIKHNK